MTQYDLGQVVGATGKGISSITKTGTSGLVDTYTITYSDSTTSTFTVTNGSDASVDIVTSTDDWSSTPSDSKVPSEKIVKPELERFRFYTTHSTSTSSAYYINDYGSLKTLNNGTSIYILNTKADNSANATLKVSDFDAKPIYTNNTAITAGEWKQNSVNLFVYTTFSSINSGNGAWIMFENMYTHPTTKQCSASIPSDVSDLTDNNNTAFTPKTHTHNYSDVNNISTVAVTVTYTDNSTETINLLKYTPPSS